LREKYTAPGFRLSAFHCPHCEVYAHQNWFGIGRFNLVGEIRISFEAYIEGLYASVCSRCKNYALWHGTEMIYPLSSNAPLPSTDMPKTVKEDFDEARKIVNASPRAAAALLRLALQKLMIHLGEKGKDLNDDIGSLVEKGLPAKIQKALDSVRVIGNNAVHPGEIDLKDDMHTAIALFELTNMIVDVMITQPKKVEEVYSKIPESAKEAIKKRNEHK